MGQIPIGVTDMSMAQVGGEQGEPALHILPGAVPLDHRLDGEPMAKVMETRPTVDFSMPQTGPTRELVEGPADRGDFQRAPEIGDEKGLAAAGANERIALLGIVTQDVDRGRMKRDEPRLFELTAPNGENSPLEIDILIPQCQSLADAQARHSQQAEQAIVDRKSTRLNSSHLGIS